jgi:hypothetical protein
MQDQPTAVTMTAACTTARHALCKGVVFSLTDAHLSDCACPHHQEGGVVRELPAAFAEQVAAFPPCDQDGAA